jgi:hypothetical protein
MDVPALIVEILNCRKPQSYNSPPMNPYQLTAMSSVQLPLPLAIAMLGVRHTIYYHRPLMMARIHHPVNSHPHLRNPPKGKKKSCTGY